MSSTQDPVGGLYYGWALGESGWNTQHDANLLKLSRIGFGINIVDRDLSSPPATDSNSDVADGDCYIVGPSATGDWAGQENNIAVYNGASWEFYTPNKGWIAFIEDEDVLSVYRDDSNAWSAGNAIT